ncbi:hypothetical protein HDU98_005183, partial [Podochytrium sp. JEL0797]
MHVSATHSLRVWLHEHTLLVSRGDDSEAEHVFSPSLLTCCELVCIDSSALVLCGDLKGTVSVCLVSSSPTSYSSSVSPSHSSSPTPHNPHSSHNPLHLLPLTPPSASPVKSISFDSHATCVILYTDGAFSTTDLSHGVFDTNGHLRILTWRSFSPAPQQANTECLLGLGPSGNDETTWMPALLDAMPMLNTTVKHAPLPTTTLPLRFLALGSDPLLSLLVSDTSPHPSSKDPDDLLASQIDEFTASVDKVATAVVGAMFSFTKTLFTSTTDPPPHHPASSTTSVGSYPAPPPTSSHHLSLFLTLQDASRKITHAHPSPFSTPSQLVALQDQWGRVLLFHVNQCEIVHVIKGARDAQVAWFYDEEGSQKWFLCLLIGRGVLEFYEVCLPRSDSQSTPLERSSNPQTAHTNLSTTRSDSMNPSNLTPPSQLPESNPTPPTPPPHIPSTEPTTTTTPTTSTLLKRVAAISVGTDYSLVQNCLHISTTTANPASSPLSHRGRVMMISKTTGASKHVTLPSPIDPLRRVSSPTIHPHSVVHAKA